MGRPWAFTCRHLCWGCKGCIDDRWWPWIFPSIRTVFSCIQPWSSVAAFSKSWTSRAAARFWEKKEALLGLSSAPRAPSSQTWPLQLPPFE